MENSSFQWLSDMGMEDPTFIHQCQMNSLDEFTAKQIESAFGGDFHHSFSSCPPYEETSYTGFERPMKQVKTRADSWNSCTTNEHKSSTPEASSSPHFISFSTQTSPATTTLQFYGNHQMASAIPKQEAVSPVNIKNSPSDLLVAQSSNVNKNYATKSNQGHKRTSTATTPAPAKPSSYSQDHILAERKRREKLSQRFIALSAIVPGLKKMDKASVLADAIKYLKQLQEQVKTLEEQTANKTMESVIYVKRSQLSADDESSSSDENFSDCSHEPLPEIEARVSNKNVLIRVHCEKRKGVLVKVLAEIEKLNLTIVNSNAMLFGESALDITVTAQMDFDYSSTVKDLVKSLRSAFRHFM